MMHACYPSVCIIRAHFVFVHVNIYSWFCTAAFVPARFFLFVQALLIRCRCFIVLGHLFVESTVVHVFILLCMHCLNTTCSCTVWLMRAWFGTACCLL